MATITIDTNKMFYDDLIRVLKALKKPVKDMTDNNTLSLLKEIIAEVETQKELGEA